MEESGIWRRVEYGEWSVEYGKYGLCPLVEYESESDVLVNTYCADREQGGYGYKHPFNFPNIPSEVLNSRPGGERVWDLRESV